MKELIKNFLIVFFVLLTIAGVFALFSQEISPLEEITLTQLVKDINQEKVKKIVLSGNEILVVYQNESKAKSRKEAEASLYETLTNYGVDKEMFGKIDVEIKGGEEKNYWVSTILLLFLPLLLFGLFFWMIFRQAKTGAMQAFNFGKARARLFGAEGHPKEKVTFKDVAGLKEAKEELKEIVDFLKHPKKYLDMGASIPRGVLLMGPPGCGKTLIARAVAGESNVPFFSISGSELIELFVGVGAARTRDLFATAKKAGRSIIFIDEIDSIGKVRGIGIGGGHDEREQTLNQILAEMDGFEKNDERIVLAATNRPDVLDPALLRPGRFDRKVVLDLPDIEDREEILKIHCRGKPLALDVNLREVAERTPGFSGADLANVVNEAALLAARKNKRQIFQEDLLESIEKVLLGPERKSHILSAKEKKISAYHEAGHALVSASLPGTEPVRKISIIARGRAAGYTLKLPEKEKYLKTKTEFLSEIATLLGGYCAEKLVFNEITTGAANDLEKASELARKLVKDYGMSEKLGPVAFGGGNSGSTSWLMDLRGSKAYSEEVAAAIDREVARFVKNAEITAKRILKKRRKLLDKIAKALIKKETIEREEFEKLVKPQKQTKTKVRSKTKTKKKKK